MNLLISSLPEVYSLYAKQFIFHKHIELTSKVITQDCTDQCNKAEIIVCLNILMV